MEKGKKRKMNKKGVIVGWLFFCCYEFGGCFFGRRG